MLGVDTDSNRRDSITSSTSASVDLSESSTGVPTRSLSSAFRVRVHMDRRASSATATLAKGTVAEDGEKCEGSFTRARRNAESDVVIFVAPVILGYSDVSVLELVETIERTDVERSSSGAR
jgi:hypothetical protein